jgi:hypothetical protein
MWIADRDAPDRATCSCGWRLLKVLPTANTAGVSWRDYGEVTSRETGLASIATDICQPRIVVV